MSNLSNNKRIAKNTVMLYLRMFLSLIIGLYTSRVVLETLGIVDYGIYGVVGGVVAMFSFINATLSGSTSRFLAFSLGKDSIEDLCATFSTAVLIHFVIAFVVLLLSETFGLWFLYHKLVIPDDRLEAAHIVFQCSVLSTLFGITQVPYNALIIAREKMDIYAYVELLNVALRLGIVFLLYILRFDKLIVYSVLVLFVSIIIAIIYRLYCVHFYEEAHFRWNIRKDIIYPMLSFSGWNFFGMMALTGRTQATSFLINIFHGVLYNAASSIAMTVGSTLSSFATNINTAFRPAIVKEYANSNYEKCINLINNGAKFSGLMMIILAFPLIIELNYIMNLWLVEVPEKAVLFCSILIINTCLVNISETIYLAILATGDMRRSSLSGGIQELLFIIVLWLLYKVDSPVESAFFLLLLHNIVLTVVRYKILQKQFPFFSIRFYLSKVIYPLFFVCVMGIFLFVPIAAFFDDGLFRFMIIIVVDLLFTTLSSFITLTKGQRIFALNYIKKKIGF